jgi:hypothetical protein
MDDHGRRFVVIPEGLKGSSRVFFVLCGAVVATHSDPNAEIQSGSLNGSLELEAIIAATNCGRAFFGTGLAGPISKQKLLQPFNRLWPGLIRLLTSHP